jgi:branched-chain amino acid transport system substrate-binding protein
MRALKHLLVATSMLVAGVTLARAAEPPVKIGAIFPLTGASASQGDSERDAILVAAEVINNPHPGLAALPLGDGKGLPGLGGRKVELDFADHQGNPATSQSQALRLITQDHVVALTGAYQSGSTLPASAVAERYGIPFVSGETSAPSLTERGFKWFFRTTPIGPDFGKAYAEFLTGLKQGGMKIDSIAMVNENTEYGTSTGGAIIQELEAAGFKVGTRIAYTASSSDVSAQVLQLKQANPDVAVFVSYTSDAILFTKTMQSLGWKPPILIGDDSGFADSAFIKEVHDLAQGVISRSSWDVGKPGGVDDILNKMFHERSGHDLDDVSARAMEGFFVLCDAINHAGSTDPAKIQAALKATDLKPEQLMVPYDGVKFNEKGQNVLGSTLLEQLIGGDYVVVWPAKYATQKPKLPYQGWAH